MSRRRPGRTLLGAASLACLGIAALPLAASGPELVPAEINGGPRWLLGIAGQGLGIGGSTYLAFLWLAFAAYLGVLVGAAALPARVVGAAIALAVGLFALAPPLLSQDVFSYISYARLGVEHGLNPYEHAPVEFAGDPSFIYVGWRDDVSAYGPLFSLLTYPLAWLPVPAALWALKLAAAGSVLALAALCARMAPARGVDPRSAAAFVALNPLVLVHVVGGAHNDGLMMLAALAGAAALGAGAYRLAGASLVAAAAIKVSAAFLAPFALLGAARRGRLAAGAVAAIVVIGAAALAAFGTHALDAVGLAGENQARTSGFSIPSRLSQLTGIDVDAIRAVALGVYLLAVAGLLIWTARGGDWLRAAAWASFGLLCATGWLLPWYVIWVLPLAALARDRVLAGLLLALCAYQLAARIPV